MSVQFNIGGTNTQGWKFTETPATGPLTGLPVPYQELLRSIFSTAGQLADQIDAGFFLQLTMVAATPQTIDFTAQKDLLNNANVMIRVRLMIMKWYDIVDSHVVTLGGAATHEITSWLTGAVLKVFPSTANNDGFLIVQAPNTTGILLSSTVNSLKIDPGASGAGQFDLLVLGCST